MTIEKSVNIRKATIDDLDQMLEVENNSFTIPWSKEAFTNELLNNKFALYYVAEINGNVCAYAGMWIIIDEAHITNVAVHPNHRGIGLGELMMVQLQTMARFYGARDMTLEVRVSNHVAKNLYQKLEFVEKGIRKNYYADTNEDALIMWVKL